MTTTTSTSPPSSSSAALSLLPVHVEVTGRAGGDLNALLPERDDVAWVRQVHGTGVLVVDRPGLAGEADALVTTTPGLRLAVRAADCGTLVLAAPPGAPTACVAVVHAGWRGTRHGVVAAAAAAVRAASGAHRVLGGLGPCIGPCCYAFGTDDLDTVAAALGSEVRATTSLGGPALDLRAAITSAARHAGVELVGVDDACTACTVGPDGQPLYFSHRARGDAARHGVLACLR